jgi:HlyD family secretion protein
MSLVQYSQQAGGTRRRPWVWVVCAVISASVGGWTIFQRWPAWGKPSGDTRTYVKIVPATLDITIRQNGELQSIDNIDINCPVMGQNTIQQIVPEGTFVKKGDVIAVLDSTEHARNLESAQNELEKAQGDVKWAREQLAIQETSNAAALSTAQSDLEVAQINLREYEGGEYPSAKREAERKLEMANIKLKRAEEDFAATKKLFDNNFVTLSEVQKADLDVVTARNEQEKSAADLDELVQYKHAKDLTEKKNKLAQAQNKIEQVKQENASNFSQKQGDLRTKERILELRKVAADRMQKNFDGCTIKAPADGMVLYASSVSMNYYREQPIQVGAKIFQEQMLVRLPDTTKMKAVAMIREARVMKLREMGENVVPADVSIVGVPKPIQGIVTKIGVLPDNSQRYLNPDAKDYPVDIKLDHTPPNLKPGTTADVVIHVGRIENALAAPVASIYSAGEDSYVFVRDTPNPKPVKVTLGESNETSVQILDGISPGAEVLMLEAGEGRELLDLAGIKLAPAKPGDAKKSPTSQPAPAVAQPQTSPPAAPKVG